MSNKKNMRHARKQAKNRNPEVGHNRYVQLPGQVKGELASTKAGQINAYICGACGKLTVVRHVHDGVTPMFLVCRNPECGKEQAVSAGYPGAPYPRRIIEGVRFEWYRPTWDEFYQMDAGMRQHIMDGGLALREIEEENRDLGTDS